MALTKVSGNLIQQQNFSVGVVTATSFTGDLTGDVTGNVTGDLTGNVTGDVTGDLTGNVTGNVSSSGANTLGSLTVTNDATVGGALTVTGNLTVNGTTTTIDTVVTAIDSLAVDGDVTAGGNLNITGVSTFQGNVDLGDGVNLYFGDDNNLKILHNGTDSIIQDVGGGNLYLGSNGNKVEISKFYGTEPIARFIPDGAVELYYDNSKKFETTGAGVTITGDARVTGILTVGQSSVTIDGTNNKITTPKLDYAGISSSISDTATAIFVYDTRKDSDGGAWRKRTQHTSWYNETLNTSTRGSRREFPAVAVIVAESTTLTIYDGDDPDLPMWINYGTMTASTEAPKAVFAKNGIIAWASGYGLYYSDFLNDFSKQLLTGASRYRALPGVRIEDVIEDGVSDPRRIVNNACNDVAMTVLPNAPIDSATGLPIPTIAVGTDGGVSVIRDDGSIFDLTYQEASNRIVNMIDIDSNGRIYWSTRETSSSIGIYFHEADLPSSDSSAEPPVNLSTNQAGANNAVKPTIIKGNLIDVIRTKDRTVLSLSGSDNKAHLNLYNVTGNVNSSGSVDNFEMVDISTDYNTGYIIGDIKGAFLSGISTASVTGTELVSNYNFTSETTDWTINLNGGVGGASVTASSNQLVFTQGTNSVWLEAYQDITTVSGEKYVFDFEIASSNTSANWRIIVAGTTVIGYPTLLGQGHHSYTFTASSTTTRVSIQQGGGAGVSGTAESLSVRIAEEDRSVNNNGLAVYGTITKSAVATGADLVAYSGWDSSNYLFQPYNSDLDFTYSMMIMLWVKDWVTGDDLLHRGPDQTRNSKTSFNLYCDAGYDYRLTLTTDGSTEQDFEIPLGDNLSGWQHLCFTLSGGVVKGFLNGEEKTLTANSFTDPIFSQATDQNGLWIGRGPVSGYPTASIALLRLSASVPSPEQIKKIYEEEKVLFQENAACTLYGSSQGVTAIAYDDSTNILYAGTSSGRSDFQGLRRINNTTVGITSAISASNGLVAEQ